MHASQLKYILTELRFSAALPGNVIDQLAEASTARSVPAGEFLFREGSLCPDLYLVESGRLALEMNVPGRGAVRILTLGPGEMAGWSALLDHGKRMTASAVAVEGSDVIVTPADKLLALCDTNRDFGFHLMRQMAAALSKRLVATRLQLLDLFADAPAQTPERTLEADA